MIKKLVIPSMALAFALGLSACSDDSTSPEQPPIGGDPTLPMDTIPSGNPSIPQEPVNPNPTPVGPKVSLASIANPLYANNVYAAWKPFHFITMENEAANYYDIAGDFADVYGNFQPAGRVIWSTQPKNSYYGQHCKNDVSVDPMMTYRGCTVSEGIGYGMVLAYVNNDADVFIRLWNYSRALRDYVGEKLTPWITYSFTYDIFDRSSATDADLDIAASLVLMHYKTGEPSFLADALTIINALWDEEVNKTSLLLYSGNTETWVNEDPVYNLSYFSPVALRLFAAVDPAHDWNGVLNAMYTYMIAVQAAGTGVFPDWSNQNGVAVKPDNGSADKTYWTFNKESVRIPWRIAWDYYWTQDPRALQVLTTLNNFIVTKSGGDPSSLALAVNYSWDITGALPDSKANSAVSSQWLSAWCATGIGTNPAWLEGCTGLVNQKVPSNNGSSYFSDILLGLYSALLNGNFEVPAIFAN